MLTPSTLSLRARLALWAIAFVVLSVVALTLFASIGLERDIRANAQSTQASLTTSMAQDIDEKLELRLEAIKSAASVISAVEVHDVAKLQARLQGAVVLRGLFDSVLIVDGAGSVVADAPHVANRVGISIADRAYFKTMVRTGTAMISDPVLNKTTGEPTIAVVAPIRDANGNMLGALLGSIVLTRKNFLASLPSTKIGETGYFYVVSKGANPQLVLHPQAKRMMTPVPPPAKNRELHRALEGFEGTVEGTNSVGLQAVFTFRHLKTVPWVLVAVYPSAEAFAPLNARLLEMAFFALAVAVLAGMLMWLLSGKLVRPLEALRVQMTSATAGHDHEIARLSTVPELEDLRVAYNELRRHKRLAEAAQRDSEEEVRRILQHAADAFVSLDSSGCVVEWNRAAEETFGWSRADAMGRSLFDIIIPVGERAAYHEQWARFAATGAGLVLDKRIEIAALHRSGREIPIELSVVAQRVGDAWTANAFMRDISERKAAEQRLVESENRTRTIADNLPVLIAYIGADRRYKFCNATYGVWFKRPASAVIGRRHDDLGPSPARQQAVEQALGGQRLELTEEFEFPSGLRHVHTVYIPDLDANGEVLGVHALTTDVTEIKLNEDRLAALARRDTLTGLPNRRHFEEALPEAAARARRAQRPMALLFLDIDHFKAINDTHGHAAGDAALISFARRLRDCVRTTDTVARLAGDEFTVILETLGSFEEAGVVADKILAAMTTPVPYETTVIHLSTSIGIAVYDGLVGDPGLLVRRADEALYESKAAGRATHRLRVVF
jgi:diguanylate cyclase (GGDEF)-like protein/PAS domain S-box-containing protein